MSNTERLVMIPLAPHTKRERQTERERRIGGDRGSQWESVERGTEGGQSHGTRKKAGGRGKRDARPHNDNNYK